MKYFLGMVEIKKIDAIKKYIGTALAIPPLTNHKPFVMAVTVIANAPVNKFILVIFLLVTYNRKNTTEKTDAISTVIKGKPVIKLLKMLINENTKHKKQEIVNKRFVIG